MDQAPHWALRAARIIVVSSWFALGLGIIGSATSPSADPVLVGAAAATSGAFAVTLTYFPKRHLIRGGLYFELLVVAGAVLTAASLTLTGRADSAYLLMALLPTLSAAIMRGRRMGITTALLSAGLLTSVVITADGFGGMTAAAGTISLFPLMALVVAQIRAILVEIERRASRLEEASIEAEAEMSRLAQTNDLLRRLTDLYGDGSTNPIEVGKAALEAIVDAIPGSFATATMFDEQGPVVVARVGTDNPELKRSQIPIGDGTTTSGVVALGTRDALTEAERHDIDRLLRPVAVSFANTMLLQDIAGSAVKEERLRLARELHDEVGPALAALGLTLDAAQIETPDPGLTETLASTRESLGNVVDDIRGIIADLRAESSDTLTATVNKSVGQLASPPTIEVSIQERRPPRGAALRQVVAIVVEATRNAHRHSRASQIVITGHVDRNRVAIEVRDNGTGFDPTHLPTGHYGIMGMRERADRIGAVVEIESNGDGTTVRLEWKEK